MVEEYLRYWMQGKQIAPPKVIGAWANERGLSLVLSETLDPQETGRGEEIVWLIIAARMAPDNKWRSHTQMYHRTAIANAIDDAVMVALIADMTRQDNPLLVLPSETEQEG